MVPDIRDQVISSGDRSITVEKLKGHFCPNCGEGILDSESYQRLTEAQRELVNAARVEAGAEIRRMRKRLKLTQTQLGENLGLGPLVFSRYERGKTRAPIMLLKLLRLLEKHPDLVEETLKTEAAYCVEAKVSDATPARKQAAD
jgi:HTH-type transcriptional regulator / antitoxin MqsA